MHVAVVGGDRRNRGTPPLPGARRDRRRDGCWSPTTVGGLSRGCLRAPPPSQTSRYRLTIGSWKSRDFAGEPIPTLEQVIGLLRDGPVGLLLELEAPGLYPGIVPDVVVALGKVPGYLDSAVPVRRIVVQSFSFTAMKEHKTLDPAVPVVLLGAPARGNLPALASWADQVNPRHHAVDRAYVDEVHRLGMECLVWTVNQDRGMRRAIRMGVDGSSPTGRDFSARCWLVN